MSLARLPAAVLPDGTQTCGSARSQRLRSSSFPEASVEAALMYFVRFVPATICPARRPAERSPIARTELASSTSTSVNPGLDNFLWGDSDITYSRNRNGLRCGSVTDRQNHRSTGCSDRPSGKKLQCRSRAAYRHVVGRGPRNRTSDIRKRGSRRYLAGQLVRPGSWIERDVVVIAAHDGLIPGALNRTGDTRYSGIEVVSLHRAFRHGD